MFTEPTTMITDFLMAAVLLVLSALLLKTGRRGKQISVKIWCAAFFTLGTASITAGISHGFKQILVASTIIVIWNITVILVGLGGFLMLSGVLTSLFKGSLRRLLVIVAGAKFILYIIFILESSKYIYVIFDYGSALLIILLLEIYAAIFKRLKGAFWIISGVVVAFIAADVQQSGIVFHKYFNFNDLYHIINIMAFYLIYRGIRDLAKS